MLGFLLFMVFFFLHFICFFSVLSFFVTCQLFPLFLYFIFHSLVFCPFLKKKFFFSFFFFFFHLYIFFFLICYFFFLYYEHESKFIQTIFYIPSLFYSQTKYHEGKLKTFLSSPHFLSSYFSTLSTKQIL